MIRQRVSTLLTTLSLLVSLSAVSVALPASTLAAIPDVTAGLGTEATPIEPPATSAQPSVVSPGAYVQFSTWARNDDTSTVSQFFLTESYERTIYSVNWTRNDGTPGTCPTTIPLNCSFGQLKPGESIDAVIVLQAISTGTSMPVEFVWSTVGIGHGESFPVQDSVGLNGTNDFSGRFLVTGDSLTVGDVETLGTNNKQSTIVFSPTGGIGVSVEDGPGVSSACVPASKCFGETSDIHVGNGSDQYGQFKVIVNLHSSEIPKGINTNNLIVYHDGEALTTICADTPVADCYSAKKFRWGIQVTIWLQNNGKLNIG
jgi:hypothetical protein